MIPFDIVLAAWIPVVVFIFALFPPARACVLVYLIGWLLLPVGVLEKKLLMGIDKVIATNLGVLVGVVLFAPNTLRNFRLCLADVFLGVFCISGFMASLTNELGVKDGICQFNMAFFQYGVPYLAGRILITSRESLYVASQTIVRAAAFYALLAIWEWRMSPELHVWLYGTFPHSWDQHIRWGCWRPIVFFPHGLALGTFFAWTGLLGFGLYRAGQLKAAFGGTAVPLVLGLVGGVVTSMSFGSWGMFLAGVALLTLSARTRIRWTACVPVLLAFAWMTMRYVPLSDGMWLVDWTGSASKDRAQSLEFRVQSENLLLAHAKEHPVFGWGTWGRNLVFDEQGGSLATTDGLWVILAGTSGLVGLCSFFLWWGWPVFMSVGGRRQFICGPAEKAILVAVGLQAANLVFNGFSDPVLTLLMGCLVTLLQGHTQQAKSRAIRPQAVALPSGFVSRSGHTA